MRRGEATYVRSHNLLAPSEPLKPFSSQHKSPNSTIATITPNDEIRLEPFSTLRLNPGALIPVPRPANRHNPLPPRDLNPLRHQRIDANPTQLANTKHSQRIAVVMQQSAIKARDARPVESPPAKAARHEPPFADGR